MTTTAAPAPFDDPEGDIILRSSGYVDFRFFKLFLSKASDFFSSLFRIPLPLESASPSDYVNGIPVVRVEETRLILEKLLQFCHPAIHCPQLTPEEIIGVYKAAQKYGIAGAASWARESHSLLIETNPMSALIVAFHFQWDKEAKAAAKRLLRVPLSELLDGTGGELDLVSGRVFGIFWTYRARCTRKAVGQCCSWDRGDVENLKKRVAREVGEGLFDLPLWYDLFMDAPSGACQCDTMVYNTRSGDFECTRSWVITYFEELRRAFRDRPMEELARDEDIIAKAVRGAQKCRVCGPRALGLLQSLAAELVWLVERAIQHVELEL